MERRSGREGRSTLAVRSLETGPILTRVRPCWVASSLALLVPSATGFGLICFCLSWAICLKELLDWVSSLLTCR